MPYFAKQNELQKEINTFLIALINIYVLLFALSVTVAVFISYYVTKPLKLIQDKMSKIKLGRASEPIEWKEEDEIGSLVREYNRMIEELQRSAELLARSERESAWREMAKQVAHEIKNPLTPMKLSVQHLQRLMENKTPDLEEKVKKLSATLIEQIETLSTIASEFSAFAKMPKANEEKTNLREILSNAIHLFKDTVDHTEISFHPMVTGDTYVYADKEQLLRVFNNLIKNAVQAIPEGVQGKVEILLSKKNGAFVTRVRDNGTGITEEAMDKIFVPSFTTKTGGMGLGLAMVKNIVESGSGKIWFETAKGKGTTFFVSFPEYRDGE
jgi:nitrogen fixation/metabolism regulation signal transduction histidine kinase